MMKITLRYDPLRVFATGRSPAAIYARRKWLGEGDSPEWKRDFDRTSSDLLKGQDSAGSWDNSVLATIRRLFGLHLTVREPTPEIRKGLAWLMDRFQWPPQRIRQLLRNEISSEALRGLPFTPGRPEFFLYGAALFLCSIFGQENHEDVLNAYNRLTENVFREDNRWCGWSTANNILRALVVHPLYRRSPQTAKLVHVLGRAQDPSGRWPRSVPFYQTMNALAHLDSGAAYRQLEAAFRRLPQVQNRDGSWGRSDQEWNTFLTLHALNNKGCKVDTSFKNRI